MITRLIRAALALVALLPAAAQAQLLHPIFQDHAVLQRDRPIAVWGDAAPGARVTVTLNGAAATARADKAGHWRATLPVTLAGGPYTLTAAAGGTIQTVSDVLVGDVWLCSGQSNMEFQVRRGLNADAEIAAAHDPQVRLLTVRTDTAEALSRDFLHPVAWQPVTPATIADFSAACWFMARDLKGSEKVPFGLIDATWGGTPIDSWRAEAGIAADPAMRERVQALAAWRADPAARSAEWGRTWASWWAARGGTGQPWLPDAPGDWHTLPAFDYWENWGVDALAKFDGILFYRTQVTLSAAQAGQAATLHLGPIDDMDMSWINDIGVGTMSAWDRPRSYAVGKGTLHVGVNTIVVAAYDSGSGGGQVGPEGSRTLTFADGTSLALPPASGWQYLVQPRALGAPPRAAWDGTTGLAMIYNGMIAPLGAYGLRGVAWYQGEADAGDPSRYAGKLAGLMADWRRQFATPDLPFLIVQLAGWGPRNTVPVESGFATVRDQQRRAVAADPHSGLAVAFDLGDVTDIHPANKQEVGRRLAIAARATSYGGAGARSGPGFATATIAGDGVRVAFAGAEAGLATYSAARPIGFELCAGAKGACRFVDATLAGGFVTLAAAARPGDRVRYCWGDSPVCNLYDRTGLPVGPFEAVLP
jgi:sialate O-acetylesterase